MKRLLLLLIFVVGVWVNSYAPQKEKIGDRYVRYEKTRMEQRVSLLCRAILYLETKGNYHLPGLSGEYGGYQFLPDTWKYYCRVLVGKQLDITIPENQDLIARLKIKGLINAGYTDEQIAAIWNCGYSNYENRKGVNKYGVPYDVPEYVNKIMDLMRHYKKFNPLFL